MRRMALRFVSGDARARIGVWLGWVWLGVVWGVYSHPPHPTQTQPTIAHPEDARANSLATQGYSSSSSGELVNVMRGTLPALQIPAENFPPRDVARSESGELSKDGHRPSMHVLILLVHREHRRNSEREIK